jgi:hypothetical protein
VLTCVYAKVPTPNHNIGGSSLKVTRRNSCEIIALGTEVMQAPFRRALRRTAATFTFIDQTPTPDMYLGFRVRESCHKMAYGGQLQQYDVSTCITRYPRTHLNLGL